MFGLPMTTEGVEIIETWDTLGMRATSSHDIEFRDVFVPAERITARRGWNALDGPLLAAGVHIAPTVASVYWGVASRGARRSGADRQQAEAGRHPMAEIPSVQRMVGLMDHKLHASWWALGRITRRSSRRLQVRPADDHDDHAREARSSWKRPSPSPTSRWKWSVAPRTSARRRSSGSTATHAPGSSIR